jgi:hypothetical protein
MSALTSAAARLKVFDLPPELSRLPERTLQVYGPVVAQQCDHTGFPIQRYVTFLVECSGGKWLLRRLVTNLGKSPTNPEQVIEMAITADDARRWLADSQIALDDLA